MEGTLLESEENALFKQFLLQVADYKSPKTTTNTCLEYVKIMHIDATC